jgi:putative SOS response-associated peptidase YedK
MCSRAAARLLNRILKARYGVGKITLDEIFRPNIYPGAEIPAIRLVGGERVASSFCWGFMPPNAPGKEFIRRYSTFNARAETLREKPLWSKSFREQRCIVVVSAWYEWPETGSKKKGPPVTILPSDGECFAFAGIWGPWSNPASRDRMDTATVVTVDPNEAVASIPHHRMPAVLGNEALGVWLDPGAPMDELQNLLKPCPSDWLEMRMGGPDSFQ